MTTPGSALAGAPPPPPPPADGGGGDGGSNQGLRRAMVLGGAVALIIGLASAGGALFGPATGTEASTSEALPYISAGALGGACIAAVVLLAARLLNQWPGRGAALALVVIAALLGALLGAALAPDPVDPDEVSPLDDQEIERRQDEYGDLDENASAGPVDRDGDGQPDLDENGDPIIGYDRDGDGNIDGYLVPCPPGSPEPYVPDDLIAAPIQPTRGGLTGLAVIIGRPAIVDDGTDDQPGSNDVPRGAIDWECDGEIDAIIEYDHDRLFDAPGGDVPGIEPDGPSEGAPYEPPATLPDDEREARADEATDEAGGRSWRNLLIIIAAAIGLAALIAGALWYLRRRQAGDEPGEEPGDEPVADVPEPPALQRSIEESIDALADPDPRQAILAAYGRLLAGFDEVGLGRQAHEGPDEHLRRALASSAISPDAAHDLTDLFALARFSPHPVDERHRAAAVDALQRAIPHAVSAR